MSTEPTKTPVQDPPPNPDPSKPPTPPPDPAKPPIDPAKPPAVPEKYELKLPKDSPLDSKSDVEKIVAYAKAQGFSNEQAQKLLDHQHDLASGLMSRQHETFNDTVEGWATQTWADPELGGVNKDATQKNLKRVMDRFAPETSAFGAGFRKVLTESGYGNHPEWVRFINAIGKAMGEDKPLTIATGANEKPKKADGEVFFGGAKK